MRASWSDEAGRRGSLVVVVGLGALYAACFGPRMSVFAVVLDSLTGQAAPFFNPVTAFGGMELPVGALTVVLVTMVLIGPVAEELVYRGFLLPWFASAIGRTPALWMTSIAFGLTHGHYGVYVLLPMTSGFVLGWARLRSGGLLAPIALHVGINLVSSFPVWVDRLA